MIYLKIALAETVRRQKIPEAEDLIRDPLIPETGFRHIAMHGPKLEVDMYLTRGDVLYNSLLVFNAPSSYNYIGS